MIRILAPFALAVLLALPGAPARPQQIDGQQAAQILGGLLALYGIKEALEDRDDRDDDRREQARDEGWRDEAPGYRYPRDRFEREWEEDRLDRRNERDWHGRDHAPRHGWDRRPGHDRPRVVLYAPDRCRLTFSRGHGARTGYDARCMRLAVDRPNLLPDACLTRGQTTRGEQSVYARRCLDRAGWITNRY
jgi:hypothetical protein